MSKPVPHYPIFVFVGGGAVTAVMDSAGKQLPTARVIDYDNEENAQCPVCGMEFDFSPTHEPCPRCEYDQSKDNALQAAVALYYADAYESQERAGDWVAFVKDHPELWECAATKLDAVYKLVASRQQSLDITMFKMS